MKAIENLEELGRLYGEPGASSLRKVAHVLTPSYRDWIEQSRFCILSTVGPEGTDATPRGDESSVVTVLDTQTLALPDWHGNNRIDSLRNIVRDPRVSLMFLVAGSNNVVRVNGSARVTADADLISRFEKRQIAPRSVTVVQVAEVYFQCARALLRSGLWREGDQSDGLPSPGQILAEMTNGTIDGRSYDAAWPARAAKTMW